MVQLLVAHGVDVNERPSITKHYQTHDDTYEVPGYSPVELAVNHGFPVVVDALLQAGATLTPETASRVARLTRE